MRYKSSNKERDLTREKPGPKVEQKFFEGRLSQLSLDRGSNRK